MVAEPAGWLGGSGAGEVAGAGLCSAAYSWLLRPAVLAKMPRFALTVVRHGETRFNKEKIIQGQGMDVPLSSTGFKQAAAAGQFLNSVQFTHAFSSDLTRTKQTMHGILEKSKFCKDMAVKYDSRLRERKYGVAEGKPLSELRAMARAAGEDCPKFTPPGGETLEEVKTRGKDFFDFICQLILNKTGQKEDILPGTPSRYLEMCLADVFPLGKSSSELDSHSGIPGLVASVLVVSHGAYMRSLFGYLLSDLKCSLPAALSKLNLSSVTPNTGISVFIIDIEGGKRTSGSVCLYERPGSPEWSDRLTLAKWKDAPKPSDFGALKEVP